MSEARIAELEARLTALEDERAIRETLQLYCRALDRVDADGLRATFHEDAHIDMGEALYQGPVDGFIQMAIGFMASCTGLHHLVGNTLIDRRGEDVALVETYVHAFQYMETPEGPIELAVGARYLDRFEKRAGAWRIARRREVVDWGSPKPLTTDWFAATGTTNRGVKYPDDEVYAFLKG